MNRQSEPPVPMGAVSPYCMDLYKTKMPGDRILFAKAPFLMSRECREKSQDGYSKVDQLPEHRLPRIRKQSRQHRPKESQSVATLGANDGFVVHS